MGGSKIQPKSRDANQKDLNKLTPPMRLFVEHLMAEEHWSPAEAARKAGYRNPSQSAYKLMNNPVVARHLGRRLQQRAEKLELKGETVLRELMRIAFFNPKNLLDETGQIKSLQDMDDSTAAAIQSIKAVTRKRGSEEEGTEIEETLTELKFWNKLEALVNLLKHLGMLDGRIPEENKQAIDWDALYEDASSEPDIIEAKVEGRVPLNPPRKITGPKATYSPAELIDESMA